MSTHERGAYAHKGVCEALRKGEKPKVQELLVDRVTVEEEVNWPTPQEDDSSNVHPSKKRRMTLIGLLDQDSPNTNGKNRGLWTTPCSDDTSKRKDKYKQGGTALSTQTKGKLNPNWVEQLMGLPIGWTACDFSVTELSHSRQKKHLGI